MLRSAPLVLLLAALAGPSAMASPRQLPCAVGPYGKIGQVNAERVNARLNVVSAHEIRLEYRVVLRNPNAWEAEVLPSLAMPGMVEPEPVPVTIPPRSGMELLVGWVPVGNPMNREAVPEPEEVQRRLTLAICIVLAPPGASASDQAAFAARGI